MWSVFFCMTGDVIIRLKERGSEGERERQGAMWVTGMPEKQHYFKS